MPREHMPIQIGLPPEPAWLVSEPAPISYLAFVEGEELPDPGDAFTALGESFGVAPQEVEPLPLEDPRVAWAFACSVPNRSARLMVWCEEAVSGASPDGKAGDARWVLFVETILEAGRALDDAVALAASVGRACGARTRLVFDPAIGVAWGMEDVRRLFLAKRGPVDERHLYRVELVARDRQRGPYWIATVGLARAGKPELEIVEVPADRVRAALELVDALAARFVGEDLPAAGVPFEAGPGLQLALVPAAEAIETLDAGAPGSAADRRAQPVGPRAVICAAGRRGAFRQVWVPPLAELDRLAANETGLFIAPRVSESRETLARETVGALRAAHARHGGSGAAFLAKVPMPGPDGRRDHVWVSIDSIGAERGSGLLSRTTGAAERVEFALADLGDWRIVGLSAEVPEVGPESAGLLA